MHTDTTSSVISGIKIEMQYNPVLTAGTEQTLGGTLSCDKSEEFLGTSVM